MRALAGSAASTERRRRRLKHRLSKPQAARACGHGSAILLAAGMHVRRLHNLAALLSRIDSLVEPSADHAWQANIARFDLGWSLLHMRIFAGDAR